MDDNLYKELDDLSFIVDQDFKSEVRKVARWLRPRKLKDGLGTGDALARMLLEKAETITPDEIRLLACLVSGQLCFDERRKRDWRTTDQKIDIFIRVKEEQLKLKQEFKSDAYQAAIKNISNAEGIGVKAIQAYCTSVEELAKNIEQTNPNIDDEKILQVIELHTLSNFKVE